MRSGISTRWSRLDPAALDPRERSPGCSTQRAGNERAMEVKRETMRYAQAAVADAYAKIRGHSLHTPVYETDAERLAWSYALLNYTAAGADIARAEERRGDLDTAVESYRRMLGVLASAAEQAREVDGLRRTYESAAQAFSHCHYELASLQERRGDLGGAVYHLEEAWRARRAPSLEARAKLGEIALRCAPDIAGIRDAVAAFHGRMPPPATVPITRWDFARHAREWLAVASQARSRARPAERRHLAIAAFNPHHMQIVLRDRLRAFRARAYGGRAVAALPRIRPALRARAALRAVGRGAARARAVGIRRRRAAERHQPDRSAEIALAPAGPDLRRPPAARPISISATITATRRWM